MKPKFPLRDPDDARIVYKTSNRARRISLSVKPALREVVVTVPGARALPKAMSFARKQKDWIDVQLEALPPAQPFIPGGPILLRGDIYTLVCPGPRGRAYIDTDAREVVVPGHPDSFAGRVRRLLIREAREVLERASAHYAFLLEREIGAVSVRDTASRWGSCITRNGKGHISYSWRLICAPDFVLDYVAAHECAHMIEDNHSPAFWKVVQSVFPDYKAAKRWLNKNGAYLHAVGAPY